MGRFVDCRAIAMEEVCLNTTNLVTFTDWTASFPNFFLTGPVHPYATWAFRGLQVIFAVNIFMASRPLFKKKDDLSDIPLTPAQRKLLGLDPSSRPPTPDSHYVTPPRYKRTSTPLSGSPSSKNSRTESQRGSPASGNQPSTMNDTLYDLRSASGNLDNLVYTSGSTFSPSPNPLLQKATMSGGLSGQRRSSYGSPSPLGPGPPRPIAETPGTPTPAPTKGSSVALNNRWLYDKGRRNSGSRFS